MDREAARQLVKAQIPVSRFLTRSKGANMYNCPGCGSGTHAKGTGAAKVYDDNTVFCHECNNAWNNGRPADSIDLYMLENDVGYNDALATLAADLGQSIDTRKPETKQQPTKDTTGNSFPLQAADGPAETEIPQYCFDCYQRIREPEAVAYLQSRGISQATAEAYWLGFDPQADPASAPAGKGALRHPEPRIIIPVTPTHYIGRATRSDIEPQYAKINNSGGKPGVFNIAALYAQGAQEVFVTEGAFDALSILEAGAPAIALNSTGNAGKLIEQLETRRTEATLILCLDNDSPGKKAAETIRQGLQRLSVRYVDADICGPYKDPNEYLQEDRNGFIDAVQRAQANTQPGAAEVEAFLRTIYTEQYRPIPTGVKSLDKLLHGGLIPQTLIFLGAEPGAGKTCLASMIFENMAKSGHRALYFNLEMSREQLMARSIARIAYVNNNWPIDALDVLQGYRQDEDTKAVVMAAAETYKEEIAGLLQYNPGDTTTSVSEILDYMEKEAKEADKKGEPAPNICIDYLQIMTGTEREDAGETIKRAVAGLKRYAKRWNAIVFCIMAQSRKVNDSGIPTLSAGRDTSAIEYSGDLQLQLTREDADGQTELTLYVTKSRFTQTNMKHGAKFILHGGQSYLEEAGVEQKDRYQNLFSDVPIH